MLESLDKIEIKDPVDLIITQIRDLISSGAIKPGDKLPAERKLASRLGVTRSQVREAITKLQIYGIVRVLPQSGTVVSGIGVIALEGLISDILKLEDTDFRALVDTRTLLEKEAARLAAMHRTDEDLAQLSLALDQYEQKLTTRSMAVEEDLLFHIKIAEASKNNVLKSLMMVITPDIVKNHMKLEICTDQKNKKTIEEHREILKMISQKDPDGAINAMELHLKDVKEFSKNFN